MATDNYSLGASVLVNTTTSNWQTAGEVAALADGGYVIVWQTPDGYNYGVYSQRYDAAGHTVSGETVVNTTIPNSQTTPEVAGLAGGGYVVVWSTSIAETGQSLGIYSQQYAASGAKVGGETLVNTYPSGVHYQQQVTGLADGGYLIVWDAHNGGSFDGVYAQRFDASGARIGGETQLNADLIAMSPAVAGTADDGFIVAWQGYDGAQGGIVIQSFDAAGHKLGTETTVAVGSGGSVVEPEVTVLSDGSYLISWEQIAGTGIGIHGQLYDPTGAKIGAGLTLKLAPNGEELLHDVSALPDGGFAVVWTDQTNAAANRGYYEQRFDAEGHAVGSEKALLSGQVSGDPASVATLTSAAYVAVFEPYSVSEFGFNINARTFTAGAPDPVVTTIGSSDADVIDGGSGPDFISGRAGDDLLRGHDGDDNLYGDGGNDRLVGGPGNDALDGGDGFDIADYSDATNAVGVSLGKAAPQATGWGSDTLISIEGLIGSAYDDHLTGSSGDDVLEGGAGNDVIDGGAGVDLVSYAHAASAVIVNLGQTTAQNTNGGGTDTLTGIEGVIGSAFADSIAGADSGSRLYGGDGNDVLWAGAGDDIIDGGAGSDQLVFNVNHTVTVNLSITGPQDTGGAGIDTIINVENVTGSNLDSVLIGDAGANRIQGNAGNDWLAGGDGDDTLIDAQGVNVMDGGAGSDIAQIALWSGTITKPLYIDLEAGHFSDGAGLWISFISIEGLIGASGADTLFGDDGDNSLNGMAGADILIGRAGNDHLRGGGGNDWLDGGDGNDVLDGGGGVDTLNGGNGVDIASFVDLRIGVYANLAAGAYSNSGIWQTFNSIEGLQGGDLADTLLGDSGDNVLRGQGGDDTLVGGLGNDTIDGGTGNDWLVGQDGDDRLIAGGGVDVLTGGLGADTFDMTGASGEWAVAFDFAVGTDHIALGGGQQFLGFVAGDYDLDGDGQLDTELGWANGNFVALGVHGLTLDQWNATLVA